MSGDGPESIPTSADPRSKRPVKKRALTPVSAQAATVEALFAKPDREIRLPPPVDDSGGAGGGRVRSLAVPPEIVSNVQGSSSGAGSGEFHVYKASRRREYARLRALDAAAQNEREAAAFAETKQAREARDDEKTRRNREKREKAKARKAAKDKARPEPAVVAAEERRSSPANGAGGTNGGTNSAANGAGSADAADAADRAEGGEAADEDGPEGNSSAEPADTTDVRPKIPIFAAPEPVPVAEGPGLLIQDDDDDD